jgi:hypothetical protein
MLKYEQTGKNMRHEVEGNMVDFLIANVDQIIIISSRNS